MMKTIMAVAAFALAIGNASAQQDNSYHDGWLFGKSRAIQGCTSGPWVVTLQNARSLANGDRMRVPNDNAQRFFQGWKEGFEQFGGIVRQ